MHPYAEACMQCTCNNLGNNSDLGVMYQHDNTCIQSVLSRPWHLHPPLPPERLNRANSAMHRCPGAGNALHMQLHVT